MKCPSRDLLYQWLQEKHDAEARQSLEAHVQECLSCQTEVHLLTCAYQPQRSLDASTVLDQKSPESLAAALSEPPPPDIAGFEILGVLGKGGMGVVYKARDTKLQRLVALKMIRATLEDEEVRSRFRAEAAAVARLQHPNIVQIYAIGEQDARPYIALEFVAGGSLHDHLAGTPQPPGDAAPLVELLARAIYSAHQVGIVHRDLKPANVLLAHAGPESHSLLTGVIPKITDFGLAKQLDEQSGQTQPGQILGTPSYMAPEQAQGLPQAIGPAADVYALGVILYEMLTGRPPFKGATVHDTIHQVCTREPVSPRQLTPAVPRDLETICLRCLEKQPSRRFATAEALAEDLRRFRAGEPIKARPVGATERVLKWARRRPALAAALVAVAGALLCLLAGGLYFTRQLRIERDTARDKADEANRQRERAETALDRTRRQLVTTQLVRANPSLCQHDPVAALELLEDASACPVDLRDFTWYYCHWLAKRHRLTLPGPDSPVQTLDITPDGLTIASAGGGGVIKLRDTATGRERGLLKGHKGFVYSVAFAPDGKRLASGAGGFQLGRPAPGELKLWDVAAGREVLALAGPPGKIQAVAFSPDGNTLACTFADKTVVLWDLAAWRAGQVPPPSRVLRGHSGAVNAIAFVPHSQTLASAGTDHLVKLWDVKTGQERATLKGHTDILLCLACSPDGRLLASGGLDRTTRLWDLPSGKERLTLRQPGSQVSALAFSPDSTLLATGHWDHSARLWDVAAGVEQTAFKGHVSYVQSVAFLPDGKSLACGCGSEYQLARPGEVRLWSVLAGPEQLILKGHSDAVNTLALAPDRGTLASGSADLTIKLWDVSSGKVRRTLEGHRLEILGVALSPDGRWLASCGGGFKKSKPVPGELKLWDVITGKELAALPGHDGFCRRVTFAPDGLTLASGGMDGKIRLWDLKGWHPDGPLPPVRALEAGGMVCSLAFAPDGQELAAGVGDKSIKLWNLAQDTEPATLTGHDNCVWSLAFAPDGQTLASGSWDCTIKLWNLAALRNEGQCPPPRTLKGHKEGIWCLGFTPDGGTLASGSGDHTIKLWTWSTVRNEPP